MQAKKLESQKMSMSSQRKCHNLKIGLEGSSHMTSSQIGLTHDFVLEWSLRNDFSVHCASPPHQFLPMRDSEIPFLALISCRDIVMLLIVPWRDEEKVTFYVALS